MLIFEILDVKKSFESIKKGSEFDFFQIKLLIVLALFNQFCKLIICVIKQLNN